MKAQLTFILALLASGPVLAGGPICETLLLEQKSATSYVAKDVLKELERLPDEEWALGVEDANQTKAYLVRKDGKVVKTPVSIVIYHGLLNSPAWMKWIAETAQAMGINVINARLPRHFTGDRADLDRLDYHEFEALAEKMTPIAESLSSSGKVIYVGHSTGGLISVFSALNHTASTAGMILFSPALSVHPKVKVQSDVLSMAGISGWLVDKIHNRKPETAVPTDRYLSTYSGVQVDLMAQSLANVPGEGPQASSTYGLVKERLAEMPIMWIDTAVDQVVDLSVNFDVASYLNKTTHYVFSKDLNVSHVHTADSPDMVKTFDEAAEKKRVTKMWQDFLRSFL